MARKRKRHGPEESLEGGNRFAAKSSSEGLVQKSLLSQYYPKILTLREYLLSKLPPSSKVRRRKIAAFTCCEQFTRSDEAELEDISLSRYLDQTLVGVGERFETFKDERWKQWTSFSQRPNNSESTIRSGGDGECSQSEVCIMWLFARG
jgi:telomerase reverse transcriptase